MSPLHLVVVGLCLAAQPQECSRLQPQVMVTNESGCFLTGELYASFRLPQHPDWVLDHIACGGAGGGLLDDDE